MKALHDFQDKKLKLERFFRIFLKKALQKNLWVKKLGIEVSGSSIASLWSVAAERRAKRCATAWHAVPPLPPGAVLAGWVLFSRSPSLLAKDEREKTCWGGGV